MNMKADRIGDITEGKTVMADLRLFAIGDQWGAVAELEDGTEVPIWAVNGNDPNETPPWLENDKAYEEWYNNALDEAHRQGYVLEGEVAGDDSETAKPEPLTDEEADVIDKVGEKSKCDWFGLCQDEEGNRYVRDFANETVMGLREGLDELCQGACNGGDWTVLFKMTPDEVDTWNGLIDKLGLDPSYKGDKPETMDGRDA